MRSHGRRSGRPRLAALLAVGVLIAISGCLGLSPASASTAAHKPSVFTVGMLTKVDSFSPFLGIQGTSYEMWGLTYDYMTSYSDKDLSPTPSLATSWDTSKNGLVWTFHIRSGVKWSDGKPLTAHDIAWTYNECMGSKPGAANWGSYLQSVTSVKAPDDSTVVLTLSKRNAVLPLLPIPILPEHVWGKLSAKQMQSYSAEPPHVVGSGPYRLVKGTASGSQYEFKANPHYWGGRPHFDEVDFQVFQAEDPLVQALRKGEVDFADGISPLSVKKLHGQPNIATTLGDSPGFDEIAFNTGAVSTKTGKPIGDGNPVLKDPRFRNALGYAINRDELARKVYQGGAEPAETVIPPEYSTYHWQPDKAHAFTFNLAKAGQLLDAAGYRKGSNGQRTMPNGQPIAPLRLFARNDSTTSTGTITYLHQWLSDLGIPSKVTDMADGKLTNVIIDGDYDIFQWGWFVEPDPNSMLSYFTCQQRGDWSDSWWCNKTYDRLWKQQHGELDQAKRVAIVKRMQRMVYDASPYQVTVYNKTGEAYRTDKVTGFKPQPDPGGVLLFQYGVANYLRIHPPSVEHLLSSGPSTQALVIGGLVGGLLVFAVGGTLGGVVGYRRASIDFRE